VVFGFSLFRMPREAEAEGISELPPCKATHTARGALGHTDVCATNHTDAEKFTRPTFEHRAKEAAKRACAKLKCVGKARRCITISQKFEVHCEPRRPVRKCGPSNQHNIIFDCTGVITEFKCDCF
jgi:hypothetical protein